MKLRIMSLATFLLIFISLSYSQETVQKKYCMSSIGYQGTSDQLRSELLMEAKRLAVGEFFGEFISSYTQVDMFTLTEDRIVASSAGFVRIKGSPIFESGDSFGEVCVEIEAYVTKEDLDKFKPINITKKHCVSDPNLTASQIKKHTKEQAIITALIDYDRKLEARNKEDLLPLIHNIKYLESGFIPGTESYCVKFEGVTYPIEILALKTKSIKTPSEVSFVETPKKKVAEEVGKTVEKRISRAGRIFFQQDFSEVEEGMVPEGWFGGERLMVIKKQRYAYLADFESSRSHNFSFDIDFPENFRFEYIFEFSTGCYAGMCYVRLILGDLTTEFHGAGMGRINKVEKRFTKRIDMSTTVTIEKKGNVVKLLIAGNEIGMYRYPQYEIPTTATFEIINASNFKLFEIKGTDLGE